MAYDQSIRILLTVLRAGFIQLISIFRNILLFIQIFFGSWNRSAGYTENSRAPSVQISQSLSSLEAVGNESLSDDASKLFSTALGREY
jgi:hypothetical protein